MPAGSEQTELAVAIRDAGSVMGLLQQSPEEWFKRFSSSEPETVELDVDRMIADRKAAREAKDFGEADRIRDELEGQGVVLEDTADGTIWRRR